VKKKRFGGRNFGQEVMNIDTYVDISIGSKLGHKNKEKWQTIRTDTIKRKGKC
jgi:hypothetical protein